MAEDLRGLRDVLLSEIKRIDQVLMEREKRVDLAFNASQRAIDKAEAEGLRSRQASNEWREAMSDREKNFVGQTSHDLLQAEVDYLRRSQDTSTGRRTAWVAAAGIIATLMAIGIGQVLRQGITASDVSQQIVREAPWNKDKTEVERRISRNEADIELLKLKVNKLEQQVLLLDHK